MLSDKWGKDIRSLLTSDLFLCLSAKQESDTPLFLQHIYGIQTSICHTTYQ